MKCAPKEILLNETSYSASYINSTNLPFNVSIYFSDWDTHLNNISNDSLITFNRTFNLVGRYYVEVYEENLNLVSHEYISVKGCNFQTN